MNRPINTDFKKFCKAFIIIAGVIFLADRLAGGGLKYLYQKQNSGLLYRSSYVLDSTNANMLVFGSSRAVHHYDPKVFEDKLNTTFYNCGRDGQGLVYSCAMASGILARYKPKCVIIDILMDEFTRSDKGTISTLFPYYDNKSVRSYFSYEGPFENLKFVSRIYPYNSLFTNLLIGVTAYNKKRAVNYNYKGYLPLKGTAKMEYAEFKETNTVDTVKVRYLKELLARLDQLHIPAFVVISPIYLQVADGPTAKLAAEMCSRFKSARFLNFDHTPLCREVQYFNDNYHLNEEGARIFSNEMIAPVRAVMK